MNPHTILDTSKDGPTNHKLSKEPKEPTNHILAKRTSEPGRINIKGTKRTRTDIIKGTKRTLILSKKPSETNEP